MKAIWNGEIIAESENTVVVEGNHYFPPDSINNDYFLESEIHTACPWKGKASYYNLQVNGQNNDNAAWYYHDPSNAASEIKDHIAFWKGVIVSD